eukprot:scaffold58264_cov53-Attheya_sp.AAC.1
MSRILPEFIDFALSMGLFLRKEDLLSLACIRPFGVVASTLCKPFGGTGNVQTVGAHLVHEMAIMGH